MRFLGCFREPGHVSAVGSFDEREQRALVCEPKIGVAGQKFLNDLLVFFRLQTAGAINQSAIRLEQSHRLTQ